MSSVRIAVVSDDRLYREGLLKLFMDTERSFAGVGRQGGAVPRPELDAARPHTLLVDSRVDGALELCAALKRDGGPAVIFVGAPDDDDWCLKALEAGASGILTRSARAEELVNAVHAVRAGNIWANRQAMATCLENLAGRPGRRPHESAGVELRLSRREMDVFRHAAAGLSNKDVADRLAISPATVKAHLSRIFQKLRLRGRAELAAAYHGVIGGAASASRGPSLLKSKLGVPEAPRSDVGQ